MKRSYQFYRDNEAEVMRQLGLKPTKNSGAGWIEKEDGQSEHLICQLKSTDKGSISINSLDIEKLEHNAAITHKLPVFVVQFLQKKSSYAVINIDMLNEVLYYLTKGINANTITKELVVEVEDVKTTKPKKVISASKKGKNNFWKEKEKQWSKK